MPAKQWLQEGDRQNVVNKNYSHRGIIVTAVLITIIMSGILPSFQESHREKLQNIPEVKPPVRITNIGDIWNGLTKSDNILLHKFLLNNSTHIDTRYVKEYSMRNGTWPNSILVARNGIVWTVGTQSHTLISFDPKQGKIKSSYPIIATEQKINSKNNRQSNQGFQMVWSIVEDNYSSIRLRSCMAFWSSYRRISSYSLYKRSSHANESWPKNRQHMVYYIW